MTTTAEKIKVQRFTAYRREANKLTTHNENQKNDEGDPQFEGVIWSDGTVTLRWLTALRSHSVWDNIGDMLGIHGHPEYGTEVEWHDGTAPIEWLQMVKEYEAKKMAELKPPDPEPLECWVNVLEGGVLVIHRTLEDAVKPNYGGPTRKRSGIYMREVTPQDEEKEKDAARYRKTKEAAKRGSYLWTRMLQHSVDQWDEMVDKAIEEKT